jgi:Ca2+-binding EF-hand superfamily protein
MLVMTTGAIVAQKASVPKSQDKVALGEEDVKQLLLLMDIDKNGKISKQEFMTFMEAEFQKLDKNKDGELDVKELTRSEIQSRHPVPLSSAVQK